MDEILDFNQFNASQLDDDLIKALESCLGITMKTVFQIDCLNLYSMLLFRRKAYLAWILFIIPHRATKVEVSFMFLFGNIFRFLKF